MGLGDLINGIGDAIEGGFDDVVDGAKHVIGTAVDDGAHVLGGGLDALGLHAPAQAVDNFGDSAADHLGDQVAEKQLGQTTDPTQLIHGDLNAIQTAAARLANFGSAFHETAQGLAGIDTSHWQGQAADAFRTHYQQHPKQWGDTADACTTAARAWNDYGDAVLSAQQQARKAIDLYQQGTQATAEAQGRYNQAVATFAQHANAYNTAASRGQDPGPTPRPPAAFSDPGAAAREQAQEILTTARHQRDTAGDQAQRTIAQAASTFPAIPAFTQRMADDAGDTLTAASVEGEHLVGGVAKGVGSMVKFVRGIDPLDPYNVTHPAAYIDHMSQTAAGLVHVGLHPQDLVTGLVGSGWSSDPAQALGELIPNVVAAVGTDGASGAAEGAMDAGKVADVAGETAANAGRTAAEDLGSPDLHAADSAAVGQIDSSSSDLNNIHTRLNDLQNHIHPDGATTPSAMSTEPPLAPVHQAPVLHAPSTATNLSAADAAAARGFAGAGNDLGAAERDLAGLHVHDPGAAGAPQAGVGVSDPGSLATDPQVQRDLAQTAMEQPDLSTLDGSEDPWVWRTGNADTYRVDNLGTDAFTNGFPPRNVDYLNVRDHVNYNPANTGFVSASTNPDFWKLGSDAKYFYHLDAPGGVDVNPTLGDNAMDFEDEIAYPGGIRPERVQGLWPILHDPVTHEPSLGEYVPNPNYVPLK